MSRVLLVEDEEHLALGLQYNLENAGYEVRLARNAAQAMQEVEKGPFDLLVLDVMLEREDDGFELARTIRRGGNFTPIIMLTARDFTGDRVRGIDAGADDYLTKPFDLDELLARIRGLLRRQAWTRRGASEDRNGAAPQARVTELSFGKCRVDFQTYLATTHDGREVQLSSKEAAMMRLFAEHEGETVTRALFLEEVWGDPGTLETRTVDNFILKLRKYFEPSPHQPRHILSVRGVGYRFVR